MKKKKLFKKALITLMLKRKRLWINKNPNSLYMTNSQRNRKRRFFRKDNRNSRNR